jgi:predicted phage baseplate assembly protein
MTAKKCGCTAATCGCCEGTQAITPVSEINRPGLNALAYRVGTHGAFLETMLARLATMTVGAGGNGSAGATYSPLLGLTTRDPGDPAIALLDSWAVVAAVLAFYQERIANEGFLRTATERRSVLQLARLVNYALRPGVAASVYLAYTLDANQTAPVDIPAGSQAQSVPGPGQLPQTFETSDDLTAQTPWNNLQVRLTQPQNIISNGTALNTGTVYFQGTTTNLNPNDLLLFQVTGADGNGILCHVQTVTADFTNNLTTVTLQEAPYLPSTSGSSSEARIVPQATAAAQPGIKIGDKNIQPSLVLLGDLAEPTGNLSKPPALQPPGSAALQRAASLALGQTSDTLPQALSVLKPEIASTIYAAWASSAAPEPAEAPAVFSFGVKASPFGSVAPLKPVTNAQGIVTGTEEWPIGSTVAFSLEIANLESISTFADGSPAATASVTENASPTQTTAFPLPSTSSATTVTVGTTQVTTSVALDSQNNPTSYTFTFSHPASDPQLTATIVVTPIATDTQTVQITDQNNSTLTLSVIAGGTEASSTSTFDASASFSADTGSLSIDFTAPEPQSSLKVVSLDAQYNQIQPQSWVATFRADNNSMMATTIESVQSVAMAAYGITGKSTQLTLQDPWLSSTDLYLSVLRSATVYAQSQQLQLAPQPFCPDSSGNLPDVTGQTIELDELYDGLTSGRWIIVSGERTDIMNNGQIVTGVTASELAMISNVAQTYNQALPGDQIHTVITLAAPLAYTYKRSTVTICGNVVDATNGATTNETMGNGNGGPLQSFALKQQPLTYVAAPTAAGAASTLEVFVNNVQWQEVPTLAGLGPKDRNFITQTDDNAVTTVIFGDGVQGAAPPTGVGNVQATYRAGIGSPGIVDAGQITLLTTKPLGVTAVNNPLDASGGADADQIDQARVNVPVATLSLDRLVSVQDYADFSRTFAGIGKAASVRLSNGMSELVYVTIAGANDVPIDTTSDLYTNLVAALVDLGDPALAIQVQPRELKLMVLSASVCILPDNQWDSVVSAVRSALLSAFSFQNIDLAQPIVLSQVISVMQGVAGVQYVDVTYFDSIEGNTNSLASVATTTKISDSIPSLPARLCSSSVPGTADSIMPAQLVYLTPNVPDTLILNQVTLPASS